MQVRPAWGDQASRSCSKPDFTGGTLQLLPSDVTGIFSWMPDESRTSHARSLHLKRVKVNFPENYSPLTDDELLMVAANRADLVREAALAMDSEMRRRGLSYQEAQAKERQVARQEIKEARRRRPSPKGTKYFVAQIRGRWLLLLLSPTLLVFLLAFPHIVSEEWLLPSIFASYGVVSAISAVQPWLRQTTSFWLSLPIAGIVQLLVGHMITVRLAPHSRSELKGASFLAIFAGYAVGIPLFLLLQKVIAKEDPESKSL